MNKLFIALLSASMTAATICNQAVVETDKEPSCAKAPADTKAVVAEAVVETAATKKTKCANCPCTESKVAEDKAVTSTDCPCEEAGKVCPCPSMQAEQK